MRHRPILAAALAVAILAPAPAMAADARAAALIREFLAAYEAVQTFQGRIKAETRKGDQAQVTRSELFLAKPASTALRVVDAPYARSTEGTRLVWFGEPTVEVATRLFGIPLKAKPSIDDSRLTGLRGWNMRDLSIVSLVALARDPRSTFKLVGPDTWLGRPQHVVEAVGPRMAKGVDRQRIWLDDQLKLPFAIEMYDGAERALRIEIEAFKFDQKLPAGAFRLD